MRAMVIGGSRGIGAAIVKRLARDGAAVAFTYVSKPERARELVAAVEGSATRIRRSASPTPTRSRASSLTSRSRSRRTSTARA